MLSDMYLISGLALLYGYAASTLVERGFRAIPFSLAQLAVQRLIELRPNAPQLLPECRNVVVLRDKLWNYQYVPGSRPLMKVNGTVLTKSRREPFAEAIFRVEKIPHRKRDSAALRFGSGSLNVLVRSGRQLLAPTALVHDVVKILSIERLMQSLPSLSQNDQESSILARASCARLLLEWAELLDTKHWQWWTAELFFDGNLEMSGRQLIGRLFRFFFWYNCNRIPDSFPKLQTALENFHSVAWHLYHIVRHYQLNLTSPKTHGTGHTQGSTEEHELAESQWAQWLVDFIHDLLLEMTRAGNLVGTLCRELLDPGHPVGNTTLLIRHRHASPTDPLLHVQYKHEEWSTSNPPYPGFEEFAKARGTRDFSYGNGAPSEKAFDLLQETEEQDKTGPQA